MDPQKENAAPVADEKETRPACRGRLVVDKQGHWSFKLDAGSPCEGTVASLANAIGPNAGKFLARHLEGDDPQTAEIVKRLDGSRKASD